jgi:hypothetical protein
MVETKHREKMNMSMCKICSKLCPVSLAIAVGLTAMLCFWVMMMWGASAMGETSAAYMQHMMPGMENLPGWQIYLYIFLKGAFVGFFVALFYDICRWLCGKMCKKSGEACTCPCSCCSGKKVECK